MGNRKLDESVAFAMVDNDDDEDDEADDGHEGTPNHPSVETSKSNPLGTRKVIKSSLSKERRN